MSNLAVFMQGWRVPHPQREVPPSPMGISEDSREHLQVRIDWLPLLTLDRRLNGSGSHTRQVVLFPKDGLALNPARG